MFVHQQACWSGIQTLIKSYISYMTHEWSQNSASWYGHNMTCRTLKDAMRCRKSWRSTLIHSSSAPLLTTWKACPAFKRHLSASKSCQLHSLPGQDPYISVEGHLGLASYQPLSFFIMERTARQGDIVLHPPLERLDVRPRLWSLALYPRGMSVMAGLHKRSVFSATA